jgi:uncharacterized membrane protein YraQ (UPF0718 family)
MSQPALGVGAGRGRRGAERWGIVLFLIVAVAGVYIAKWSPSYAKAFMAAAKHSIGGSVISGTAAAPAAAGWAAAWQHAVAYVNAIWIALVVGLLVGSGVEAALPRAWLLRVLGSRLGAAGAGTLLITLPAVSLPSLAMVGRALPVPVLVFVAVAVAVAGLLTGASATIRGF